MALRSITLEDIAEKLNGKIWEKEGKKRVYLNQEGYNTNKMKTTTYVYQDEFGIFKVSCFIECPSQPITWIESQKEIVIGNVKRDIAKMQYDTIFRIADADGNLIDKHGEIAEDEYCAYQTYNERMAQRLIELDKKFIDKGYVIKSFPNE